MTTTRGRGTAARSRSTLQVTVSPEIANRIDQEGALSEARTGWRPPLTAVMRELIAEALAARARDRAEAA